MSSAYGSDMTTQIDLYEGGDVSKATLPLVSNGYVLVAQPAIRVRADEVLPGDIAMVDGYVFLVAGVRTLTTSTLGPDGVVHITGTYNICRCRHEMVSVLRIVRDNTEAPR